MPLLKNRALILMLHRFRDPERGVVGYDPVSLRRTLDYLRSQRYEIAPLADLFRRLKGQGPPVQGVVAFTIDDGYYDQASVAAPIFAEFDCPVTTFVTTGFLDGETWFWWDKVEFIFRNTRRDRIDVTVGARTATFNIVDEGARRHSQLKFTGMCKEIPDTEMRAAILALAEGAGVALPADPPPRYAPMSWAQLRSCELSGMSFGPHTVTHPILARTSDAVSTGELTRSWERLSSEAANPVPIFCYPNGQAGDFGAREIRTLRDLGIWGAVIGYPGYASATTIRQNDDLAFLVPRFSIPSDKPRLIQLASGIERAKEILRGKSGRPPAEYLRASTHPSS